MSALWTLAFAYKGIQEFRGQPMFLDLGPTPMRYLAGIGSLTVGSIPLIISWLLHKFHKSRERGRLIKEKHRIEVRLQKLDEQRAAKDHEKTAASPDSGKATV